MYKLLLTLTLSLFSVLAFSQFEGTIDFTKTVGKTITTYRYYVKGDKVRIEEIGENNVVSSVQIIDTKTNSIVALSPDTKIYFEISTKRKAPTPVVTTTKTGTTKTIATKSCEEVKVKSSQAEITYYISKEKFDFYAPLLTTLQHRDKSSTYFLAMEGNEGAFPMKSIEKKADGTLVSVTEATKVEAKVIDASLFEIPEGYSKFDR